MRVAGGRKVHACSVGVGRRGSLRRGAAAGGGGQRARAKPRRCCRCWLRCCCAGRTERPLIGHDLSRNHAQRAAAAAVGLAREARAARAVGRCVVAILARLLRGRLRRGACGGWGKRWMRGVCLPAMAVAAAPAPAPAGKRQATCRRPGGACQPAGRPAAAARSSRAARRRLAGMVGLLFVPRLTADPAGASPAAQQNTRERKGLHASSLLSVRLPPRWRLPNSPVSPHAADPRPSGLQLARVCVLNR